jgi:putative alpha-1,2-mannosidase
MYIHLQYRNLWSSEQAIFCPRGANATQAEMTCPKNPSASWSHYIEGNALHYSWYAPNRAECIWMNE